MKFDTVIIGGGIIGSATAYFLSRQENAGSVCVIEPDPTYQYASTPQGAGGVRRLFSRPENIAMSQFSLDFYADFENIVNAGEPEIDISFRRQGYLFVVGHKGAKTLEANYNLQKEMGVPADLLDVAALKARFPSLGVDDLAMGCHSPEDAWIDPNGALQGFRRAAESNGVTYLQDRVVGFETRDHAIIAAQLGNGPPVRGDIFVNTAGPWCGEIAEMIGATLPVQPMCRVQHYWLCEAEIEPLPLVKDESGMFFRPEGQGFAGGCPSFEIEPGFNVDVERGYFANYFEETVWPLIANRLPGFDTIRLQRTWGGHYAQNRFDGNMIIGKFSAAFDNILTACGFSGHGLMHAPAVGRALAERILHGRDQSIDLTAFEITRVRENRPYNETGIK